MHGDCASLCATLRFLSGHGSSIVIVVAAPLAGSTNIGVRANATGALFAAIRSPFLPSLKSRLPFVFTRGIVSVFCSYP